jgi:hypothetical protein
MVKIQVKGLCPQKNYLDRATSAEIKEKIAEFLAGTPYAGADVSVDEDWQATHEGYPKWSLSVTGLEQDVDEVHRLLAPLHDMFAARRGVGERLLVCLVY